MTAITRGAQLIAVKEFKFALRRYLPGDKFDHKRLGIAHRRAAERLLQGHGRKIDELSAESMKDALRFRPEGTNPPRGFTIAGLKAFGYLTDEQVEARGWGRIDPDREIDDSDPNAAPPWAPEDSDSWKVYAEGVNPETPGDADFLWVVPYKTGGATRYFVYDRAGDQISPAASIGGKANAEKWAREFMVEREKAKAEARAGDPDWTAFPENPDDWSDAQVEEFDAWYDSLAEGADLMTEHPAVTRLVEERRQAAADAGNDQTDDQQQSAIEGLTADEAKELIEAMSDDELRAHVAKLQNKQPEELEAFSRLALMEMAEEAQPQQGAADGGDVSAGSEPAA